VKAIQTFQADMKAEKEKGPFEAAADTITLTLPTAVAAYAGHSFMGDSTTSQGGYGDPTSGTYDKTVK